MADIETGVENRDSDPAPREAGSRHLGGLQAPGEFLLDERGNGLGPERSRGGRPG